jgi:hypothetical protein
VSFFSMGPPSDGLPRYNSLADADAGKTRWVQNKDTDQVTVVNSENVDGTGHWEIRAYNPSGADVAYTTYHLTFDGDEETNPRVIPWTNAGNDNFRMLVVPQEAVAAGTWGWYAFAGICKCFVEGTTDVAKDDYLMLDTDSAAGLTSLITSGGTVETNSTVAVACEAQTVASVTTAIRVNLLGAPKICDTQ